MKKLVTLIAVNLILFSVSAQLNYTKQYKRSEPRLSKIGETKDFTIFLDIKPGASPLIETLTYFTISMKDAEPKIFEKEKFKIDKYNLRLTSTELQGEILYELYTGNY